MSFGQERQFGLGIELNRFGALRSGLNTTTIDRLMHSLTAPFKRDILYLGTFPLDQFPLANFLNTAPFTFTNVPSQIHACILNTDPSYMPGQHWVAFYLDPQRVPFTVEFFDSYGHNPAEYGLELPSNLVIEQNILPLHGSESVVCGHYCMLFIHRRMHLSFAPNNRHPGISPLSIVCNSIKALGASSKIRDKHVKKMINKLSSSKTHVISAAHLPISYPTPTISLMSYQFPQTSAFISSQQTSYSLGSYEHSKSPSGFN